MSAEPTTKVPDDLRTFLSVFWRDGDVREVRLPKWDGRRVASGYFDDREKLAAAVATWDGSANVYVTLNPVNPVLLHRAENRIKPSVGTGETTSDPDVTARRWMLVDVDPRRATNTSATAAENAAAATRAHEVRDYLREHGWPDPVEEMTGNGFGLLYPIDLPNDTVTTAAIEGVLLHLAERFDDELVAIDRTVSNAARISCLVGTMKVKGTDTPERPHRRSALAAPVPDVLAPVPLERLAALAPRPETRQAPDDRARSTSDRGEHGWVRDWLDIAGIEIRREVVRKGAIWYVLAVCPFHEDDPTGDCGPGEWPSGAADFHCFHNRGIGMKWADYREKAELFPPLGGFEAKPKVETPPSDSAIVNIDAYRAAVPTSIPWVVEDVAYAGGVTLIAGPPKKGKSTLAAGLQRCRETGEDFLGSFVVKKGPTLLVTEEGGVAVVHKTDGLHQLDVLDRRAAAGLRFVQVIDLITEWATTNHDGMVFIDTLAIWAGIKDENDASETTRAISRVAALAQTTGLAVVLIHHTRKSGGDDGEGIRGSSAILATVDIALEHTPVRPHCDDRYLDISGRIVMQERHLLTFDRATGIYTLGDQEDGRLADIEADLAGVPADGPGMTRDELTTLWQRDSRKRSEQLLNLGRMRRAWVKVGRQHRWLYWSIPPVFAPEPRDED